MSAPAFEATLARINRQSEEENTSAQADRLQLAYAKLDGYPFSLDVLRMVPRATAAERRYAAYVRSADRVRVALVHAEDALINDEIALLGRKWGKGIERTIVSGASFEALLTEYDALELADAAEREAENERVRALADHDYLKKVQTLDDLQAQAGAVSVTELIDVLTAAAINQAASDIHIEPGPEHFTVRFRIDGVLKRVLELPQRQHHPLVSRLKIMADIKLDKASATQDGRFSLREKGVEADVRVSMVPTGYGEAVVMRILRQDRQQTTLPELGFSAQNMELIERALRRPYGLIAVTGPTGSGKSTTLYALLQLLNSPEKKILTLEDPIEYQIAGVQQSQVDTDAGYSFAEGLRGALRQDPDIVMVGEIRDPETATVALNASLTGHLVLTTLHTNDAVTAHTRFLELGVEPFLLSGSIQLIVAQRLVRRLQPGGTPEAPNYGGRLVIAEALAPTADFERAVREQQDNATLRRLAREGGMVPMLEDGLAKVRAGMTDEREVYRVTAA